jgi:beta-lactamase superfamily II metal-dependent hydrolase
MVFTLEALAAKEGDCLLLHYGDDAEPHRILIDGGPSGVFTATLRKRLLELKRPDAPLPLELVMVSHIDADHIKGVLDLLKSIKEQRDSGLQPPFEIRGLWHNSFEILLERVSAQMTAQMPQAAAVAAGTVPAGLNANPFLGAIAASVKQGNDVRNLATQLAIPINPLVPTPLVLASKTGKTRLKLPGGLTLTILGPHEAEIERLEEEWVDATHDGRASTAAFAADYLNRTAANVSSIVVLAEFRPGGRKTRRMLLTGDAGGDLMMEALELAGLLTHPRPLHVDLLKVQHHGSRHSVDKVFFTRVTADHYVISGNGKHENPHAETLTWLSEARAREEYHVHLTYREGKEGLEEMLDRFLAREAEEEPRHHYHFRGERELSISVPLA